MQHLYNICTKFIQHHVYNMYTKVAWGRDSVRVQILQETFEDLVPDIREFNILSHACDCQKSPMYMVKEPYV